MSLDSAVSRIQHQYSAIQRHGEIVTQITFTECIVSVRIAAIAAICLVMVVVIDVVVLHSTANARQPFLLCVKS